MTTFSQEKPWRTEASLQTNEPKGYTDMVGQTEEESSHPTYVCPPLRPHIASLLEENIENAKAGRPRRVLTKSETMYMDKSYQDAQKIKEEEIKRKEEALADEAARIEQSRVRSNEMLVRKHCIEIKQLEKLKPKTSCAWARG